MIVLTPDTKVDFVDERMGDLDRSDDPDISFDDPKGLPR